MNSMEEEPMDSIAVNAAWLALQDTRKAWVDGIYTATPQQRQELLTAQQHAKEALEDLGVVFA